MDLTVGFRFLLQAIWCFSLLPYLKQTWGLLEILNQYVHTGKWPEQKTDHLSVWVRLRMPGAVSRYPHFIVLVGHSGNPADLCFKMPNSNLGAHTGHPGSSFSWASPFPSDEYQCCALIRPRSLGLLSFAIYHSAVYITIHMRYSVFQQSTNNSL
jgi:hypothetical protein